MSTTDKKTGTLDPLFWSNQPPASFLRDKCAEYAKRLNKIELERNALAARVARMKKTLREVETICTESAADCRKRMGTRVGNILALTRAAITESEAGK